MLPEIGSWIFGQFGKFGVWFGFLAGIFLLPVYVFFFLVEKQGIERQWTDYLPVRNSKFKDELVFCLRAINDYLIVFFRSQVLVAICDAVLYTIGFLMIGLPYAFLLGFVSVFLTIIPFIGATLICGAALIIGFASTGGWQLPALVLVVFAVVQTAEGLYIQPKIVGDRVGLHPLTVIVAVMIGTTLFGGLLGGILAIPLTAALRVIMFRYVWIKRNDMGQEMVL
jgi:predicted PurR-regulated permease PerM